MELIKITDLTNQFGISSRTLRYYEQAGLLTSIRPDFEKYRYYDEHNIERLKQIMVLRKMQIPIRDIQRIYENEDMSIIVETFVQRIQDIDAEIIALSELKGIIDSFLQKMIENGITKISALPLLYEEVNKHISITQEKESVSYEQLVDIGSRLNKTIEVRLVKLPPMEMLCSKRANSEYSDIDGFWEYLDRNHILSRLEEHILFEFQDSDNQPILMVKEEALQPKDSDYSVYSFEGGLFAVGSTYADENIDEFFHAIVKSFDENLFYEVDYQNGSLRHEVLIETVISPDGRREKIDVFVPIKTRIPAASNFDGVKQIKTITPREIYEANPILVENNVSLSSLKPIENPYFKITESGEVEYIAYISIRTLSTKVPVKIPFRVDVEFKIDKESELFGYGADEGSIRIQHGNSFYGINMENNADERLSKEAIAYKEPILGNYICLDKLGKVQTDVYNKLTWIVGEKHFAVIINDEVRYCVTQLPYMSMDLRLQQAYPIIIGSNGQGKKYFRSIGVYQLKQIPKLKMRGENLKVNTKLSNNIISNIHRVVTDHYGENYWFNGCAKYVMECMNEPDYDYDFFAGLTGDNFTQVYYHDHFRGDGATDYLVSDKGGEYIEEIFDQCGYASSFIPNKKIMANREMYLQTLIAYIDKGVPVIRYHWSWSVIVGYEDFGKTLLVMIGNNTEPERIPFHEIFKLSEDMPDGKEEEYGFGWLFVGEKTRNIPLGQIYRKAIQNLAQLLTMKNEKYCFGADAFRAWATDISNGKFDFMKPEEFDGWSHYTVFVCNLATNSGCCQPFLIKAVDLNTDLDFLKYISKEYRQTGHLWNDQNGNDLEGIGGGFNITLDALQDKTSRDRIVSKIMEFARCIDNVITTLRENMDEEGNLRPNNNINSKEKNNKAKFITVDTDNWVNSPYVPQPNGKISLDKNADGVDVSCWYIDSRNGRWTALNGLVQNVSQGDYIKFTFWAKLKENPELFKIDIMHSDWEKRKSYDLWKLSPNIVGRKGDYYLFCINHMVEESSPITISINSHQSEITIFSAVESDLSSFGQ